ncbi:MAG TPA: hypothetical protein VFN38_05515 [Gemmatimonadaceae bacterium]|nr:hypothetical protein [Gemmatimonadaceae bacterium]
MTRQLLVAGPFVIAGVACFAAAVVHERRMHRHRQPGVTYAAATLRRDGGWLRRELFTDEGLRHQRRASRFGLAGAACFIAFFIAWVAIGVAR